MQEYTIHPLAVGINKSDQGVMTYLRDYGKRIYLPIKAIIAGFCCNDKNFPSTGPAIAPGVHIDLTEAYDSIQKIKEMADMLIPLHDLSIGRMKTIPQPG